MHQFKDSPRPVLDAGERERKAPAGPNCQTGSRTALLHTARIETTTVLPRPLSERIRFVGAVRI